jgi:hypothetical protein
MEYKKWRLTFFYFHVDEVLPEDPKRFLAEKKDAARKLAEPRTGMPLKP